MANLNEKVTDIVSEHLGVEIERINYESRFVDDLGADSLDLIDLVMAFEEEFDCEIPDTDADQIRTLGDAVKYFHAKTL